MKETSAIALIFIATIAAIAAIVVIGFRDDRWRPVDTRGEIVQWWPPRDKVIKGDGLVAFVRSRDSIAYESQVTATAEGDGGVLWRFVDDDGGVHHLHMALDDFELGGPESTRIINHCTTPIYVSWDGAPAPTAICSNPDRCRSARLTLPICYRGQR